MGTSLFLMKRDVTPFFVGLCFVLYSFVAVVFLFMYWFDQLGKSSRKRERRFGKTNIVNFLSRPLLTKILFNQ